MVKCRLQYWQICSLLRFFLKEKNEWMMKNEWMDYRLIPSCFIGWWMGYERRGCFLLVRRTGWNAERVRWLNRQRKIISIGRCFICLFSSNYREKVNTGVNHLLSSSYLDSLNYPITIIIIVFFVFPFSHILVWCWSQCWWQQLD